MSNKNHANEIDVSVPILTNGVVAEIWVWTTTQEVTLADPTGCPLVNVPRPDAGMPVIPKSTFNPTQQVPMSIFGVSIPSAVMGDCGVHEGPQRPCSPLSPTQTPIFTTVDVVPRNIELCIDSRLVANPHGISLDRIQECDPNTTRIAPPNARIPLYSPVDGCALYIPGEATLIIEFDVENNGYTLGCNQSKINTATPRYQIVLTHLVNSTISSAQNTVVQRGALIGYFCRREDWSNCGASTALVAPHVALQLRTFSGQYRGASPETMLAFLASPSCLYDNWQSTNNNTISRQINSTLTGCIP